MSIVRRIDEIRKVLEENSSVLEKELEKITRLQNHPDTKLLEFEFGINDFGSIVLYPMTKEGDQVFDEEPNGRFVGNISIPLDIREILQVYLDELDEEFDEEYFDEIVKTVVNWFSCCWDKIKDKTSLPAYISTHDTSEVFDLTEKTWIESGDQYDR